MKRRIAIAGLLFVFFAGPVSGQNATVVYVDDPEEVRLVAQDGREISADIGTIVGAGTRIVSGDSNVELVVHPTQTRVRIRSNTEFVLDAIEQTSTGLDHQFGLLYGKFRAIAVTGNDVRYTVRTPAAVAGVRGTDFVQSVVPGEKDWICVRQGSVDFTSLRDNRTVVVRRGRFAEVYSDSFGAERAGRARIRAIFADVLFADVPFAETE